MEIANLQAVIGVETGRFRAGMAGVDAQLRGTAGELRAVDGRAAATGAAMQRVGQKSALARAGAMGLKVGLAGVAFAAYEGFKRMQDQERVSAMTANTLKNTANAAGLTQDRIEGMAGSLALMTGVSKSTVQGAENILLGFKNVTRDSGTFKQVLSAAMDRSAKSGRDLIGVTRAIGMAFNDPIGGMGRLARAGIFLDSTTKAHIKDMTKAGQIDQARALILDKVSSSAKGAAMALGQTTTGQLNRMKEALGQMEEQVAAALLPALLSIGPPIISLVQSLAPAFKTIAGLVGDVVSPLAAMASAVLNDKAALVALTAVLGTLLAMNVASRVVGMAAAFNQIAAATAGTKLVGGVASMVGSVGKIGGAFIGAAAGVGQFAQKASVFDGHVATAGRFAGAMNLAKSEMSAFGAAASSAMGGPWVMAAIAGVAAVTALSVAIGPALVESFMGAGSATDQYAAALQSANTASQALVGASGQMETAMLTYTQAVKAEADARRAAAAAGGNDAAANARLSAAIARTDQVRGAAHSGLSAYISGLQGSTRAVQDATVKLSNAVAPLGMVDVKTKEGADAWRKHEQAVRLAQQAVGNTTAYKNQQAELGRLSDYLKGLGPKYATVAREAANAAKMKPGEAQTKAVEKLMGDLSKIDGKVKGANPTIKVKADASQAQKTVDALKAKLDLIHDKTVTVTVNQQDVTSGQANISGAGSGNKGSKARETAASPYAVESYRNLTSPQNMSSIVGSTPVNSGILDLIAQANKAKISFDALGLSEAGATQTALNLRTAIAQNAQWQSLSSTLTKAHTASVRAKTDAEKESAKKALASARAHVIHGLVQDGVSPKVLKHATMTTLLGMAQDRATKKAQNLKVALGDATDVQAILQTAVDTSSSSADAASTAIDGVSTSLDGVTSASDAASANLSRAQGVVDKAMQKVRSALTPTEALIKSLQDQGNTQDLANGVSDAMDALARAQEFGDSTQIRDAQRTLANAQRQQRIAQLQPVADAERTAVNDFLDSLDPAAIAQQLVDHGGDILAGGWTLNLNVTDNTFSGLNRDQVDSLAAILGPAIGRRVNLTI